MGPPFAWIRKHGDMSYDEPSPEEKLKTRKQYASIINDMRRTMLGAMDIETKKKIFGNPLVEVECTPQMISKLFVDEYKSLIDQYGTLVKDSERLQREADGLIEKCRVRDHKIQQLDEDNRGITRNYNVELEKIRKRQRQLIQAEVAEVDAKWISNLDDLKHRHSQEISSWTAKHTSLRAAKDSADSAHNDAMQKKESLYRRQRRDLEDKHSAINTGLIAEHRRERKDMEDRFTAHKSQMMEREQKLMQSQA